ncbi:MAG: amidohydrolase [Bacteriovoracia bacterium]
MLNLMIIFAFLFIPHTLMAESLSVDLIIHNANIVTMEKDHPKVESMAIAGGKIIAIGKSAEILNGYKSSRIIDLKKRHVLPGLIDSHGHIHSLAQKNSKASLDGSKSIGEVIQRLKDFAPRSHSKWLLGRGWDQNLWPGQKFPTKEDLDAAFPDTPVYLTRVDGHASWVNSRALALAGVDRNTKNPEGGIVVKDESGEPTGVLIDRASNLIRPFLPRPSHDDIKANLKLAMKELSSLGITSIHDAGLDADNFERLEELKSEGELKVRVYGMFSGTGQSFKPFCRKGPVVDPMLSLRSVKLFMDGALGSRGAALLHDYSDQPGHQGLLLKTPTEINEAVLTAYKCGFQVGVHAIGDRGNRLVLDAIENAIKETKRHDLRPRIEHAQVLHPSDIKRFKSSGVIASMQPVHATSDMLWAEQRLGPVRILGAYAWRSLLDLGVVLASGSDFPIERANPFEGIYAAVTRKDKSGSPRAGWYPSQKITREEALMSFTRGGAFASFMENEIGSLGPGKYADFIVVDRDIFSVPESEIISTKVLETYLNGKKVY